MFCVKSKKPVVHIKAPQPLPEDVTSREQTPPSKGRSHFISSMWNGLSIPESTFNILLVGITGAGKSTLINQLANYCNGNLFLQPNIENIKVAIPTQYLDGNMSFKDDECDRSDPAKSQTRSCLTYSFEKDGRRFNFIDTPGFAHIDGDGVDEANVEQITRKAAELSILHAVVLVFKAADVRSTRDMRSVLSRIRCMMPDEVFENIIVIVTRAQSIHDSAFKPDSLRAQLKLSAGAKLHPFYMENSAFMNDLSKIELDVVAWNKKCKEWAASMQTMEELFALIPTLAEKTTEGFKELSKYRDLCKEAFETVLVKMERVRDYEINVEEKRKINKDVLKAIRVKIVFPASATIDIVEEVPDPNNKNNLLCTSCRDEGKADICHIDCSFWCRGGVGAGAGWCTDAFRRGGWWPAYSKECKTCRHPSSAHIISVHTFRKTEKLSIKKLQEDDRRNRQYGNAIIPMIIKHWESVLEDVAASATAQHAVIEKIEQLKRVIEELRTEINDEINKFQANCKKIHEKCSGFDFGGNFREMLNNYDARSQSLAFEGSEKFTAYVRSELTKDFAGFDEASSK